MELRSKTLELALRCCQYATQSPVFKFWHDCARYATHEVDGVLLCQEHKDKYEKGKSIDDDFMGRCEKMSEVQGAREAWSTPIDS